MPKDSMRSRPKAAKNLGTLTAMPLRRHLLRSLIASGIQHGFFIHRHCPLCCLRLQRLDPTLPRRELTRTPVSLRCHRPHRQRHWRQHLALQTNIYCTSPWACRLIPLSGFRMTAGYAVSAHCLPPACHLCSDRLCNLDTARGWTVGSGTPTCSWLDAPEWCLPAQLRVQKSELLAP